MLSAVWLPCVVLVLFLLIKRMAVLRIKCMATSHINRCHMWVNVATGRAQARSIIRPGRVLGGRCLAICVAANAGASGESYRFNDCAFNGDDKGLFRGGNRAAHFFGRVDIAGRFIHFDVILNARDVNSMFVS